MVNNRQIIMKHIDLFSGIGGFSLAVEAVWPNSEHIFCEIDSYCQALLKKRFERSVIFDDIKKFTADIYWNRLQEQEIYILTGGFPCQPFSEAGKRKGSNDDRYLWPEMLRVIQEFKPTWVVAENVRGLFTIENGMVFEQMLTDLEGKGYEVQPLIIPACAINAPHRRDRVWIIAKHAQVKLPCRHKIREEEESSGFGKPTQYEDREKDWQQNWFEVATRFCGVDDGLPARVDGLELSKSRHRIERLKGLGNSIVPQVAIEIFKAIMLSEKEVKND